jgi:hypothetical protein
MSDKEEDKTAVRGKVIDGEVYINANDMIIFMSQVNTDISPGVAKKTCQVWIDWLMKYKKDGLGI